MRLDRDADATMIPAADAGALLAVIPEELDALAHEGRLDRLTIGGVDFYWKRQVVRLAMMREWRMERLAAAG